MHFYSLGRKKEKEMEKKPLVKIVTIVVTGLCLVVSCVVCFTALPTKQPEVEIKPSPSVTETTAPPTRTPLPIPTETSCDPNRVLAYLQKLENDRLTIKTTAEEIVANPQLLNNYAYTRAALNTATKMDKYYEKPEPQACLAKLHSKAHFVFSSWSLGWGFVKLGDFDQADINFQMTAWFAEDLTAYLEEVSESLRNP
jgi:hypothetical protein